MADNSNEERNPRNKSPDGFDDNADDDDDDLNNGASSSEADKKNNKKRRRFSREEDEKILEVRNQRLNNLQQLTATFVGC